MRPAGCSCFWGAESGLTDVHMAGSLYMCVVYSLSQTSDSSLFTHDKWLCVCARAYVPGV